MINLYNIRPKGFNVGNDVIHIALQNVIRRSFPEGLNMISLPATSKWEAHRKGGLGSGTVYEINQFGHGVIVGGGNLYENGELEVDEVALRALSRPLMIFSVSRGRVYDRQGRLMDRTDVMHDSKIRLLNEKANVSLSRDRATADYIERLGCNGVVGGCPTLFLHEAPLIDVPVGDEQRTDALISVRTPTLMSIPVERQYEVRDEVLRLIETLRDAGYPNVKLLCHDHRDIPFAASFRGVGYLFSEDVHTYLSILRNTRLNVTYRLHSFLPCMSLGIPAVKISYDERSESLMETIGLGEWNVHLMRDDVVGEVRKRIESLCDLEQMKERLRGSTWADLRERMVSGCAQFADLVRDTHATHR